MKQEDVDAAVAALDAWVGENFQQEDGRPHATTDQLVPYLTFRWMANRDGKDWEVFLLDTLKGELSIAKGKGAVKIVWRQRPLLEIVDAEAHIQLYTRFAPLDVNGALVKTGNDIDQGDPTPNLTDVSDPAGGPVDPAASPVAIEQPHIPNGYDIQVPKDEAVLMCAHLVYQTLTSIAGLLGLVVPTWEEARDHFVAEVNSILDNPESAKASPAQIKDALTNTIVRTFFGIP